MSLLQNIIKDGEAPAQKVAYLINIIRELGWDSFTDPRTIKPNLRRTQLYLRKKSKILTGLFGPIFNDIKRDDIVDILNPLMIEIWHVQIIGSPDAASLQLLTTRY